KNPLPFELSIDRVVTSAGLNGTVFAEFDHTFSTPFVIGALGTGNSGIFGDVSLPRGANASLEIIPVGALDLLNTDVFVRVASIDGHLGFPLEIDGLKQSDVPTTVDFDAKNPLPFELSIDRVVSSAGLNGTVFAEFDHAFSTPFVIKPLGTANSGIFGNVSLPQGVMASLGIIPVGALDLLNTDVFVRAGTINGKFGFPLQIDGLKQSNVSTT
ncbi:hypothetical protein C0992_006380, partial [Termitomyces sp. T32_za158]